MRSRATMVGLVVVAFGCAPSRAQPTRRPSAVAPPSASARYPATYVLLDDEARARRGQAITEALARELDVRAIEVDVAGFPVEMRVRPRAKGLSAPLDESSVHAWRDLVVAHADLFGIDDPAAFAPELRLTTLVAEQWATTGASARLLVATIVIAPVANGELAIRGHDWPRLGEAAFDPEPVAAELVGHAYTLSYTSRYTGPHCRGCDASPPTTPSPEDLVSTRADVEVAWTIAPVCEGAGRIAMRQVATIGLSPRRARADTPPDDPWTIQGTVTRADPALSRPRVRDGITGEDLSGHRVFAPLDSSVRLVASHGWSDTMCTSAPADAHAESTGPGAPP